MGDCQGMSEIAARRVAFTTFAVTTALLLTALVLEWLTRGVAGSNGFGESGAGFIFTVVFALLFWTFPVASTVIATRRPRNPIGWLLLAIGHRVEPAARPPPRTATTA